jgi:hypothetical protein
MKTFATILFAICVFSQLALSAEWNNLPGNVIFEIGNKLEAKERAKFSTVSSIVRDNVRVSPQDVLEHAVNSENYRHTRAKKLLGIKTSNISKDAFVVQKGTKVSWDSSNAECVKDELLQWKNAFLSATESEENAMIFHKQLSPSGIDRNIIQGNAVSPYAFWNKYSLSEIAACINDAYDKVMEECFVDEKVLVQCSVYFFACGFDLYAPGRGRYWTVGESTIFL